MCPNDEPRPSKKSDVEDIIQFGVKVSNSPRRQKGKLSKPRALTDDVPRVKSVFKKADRKRWMSEIDEDDDLTEDVDIWQDSDDEEFWEEIFGDIAVEGTRAMTDGVSE